jgi:signal transduction histidine kinase
MSSVSEELLNPLLNIKKATEILRRLLQFLKDNSTQSDNSREQFIQQNLNQYLEIFQEEWQKEFGFVHDLLNFKFLYELQDEDPD